MDTNLIELVEPIRRAKGDFLYTYGGRRLVDLWKQGGRAILGHGSSHQLTRLKDTLARGVWMPAPHPGTHHLERALQKLFPGKEIRIYRGLNRALGHLGRILDRPVHWEDIPDPASPWNTRDDEPRTNPVALWRPWAAVPTEADLLIPVLPVAWPEEVAVVLFSKTAGRQAPPSELISPVFAEYAQRAVHDLLLALQEQALPRLPRTQKVLGSSIWKGQGLYWYLDPDTGGDTVAGLFQRFLAEGFLMPPVATDPLILPFDLSPGLDAKLGCLLSFTPEA